MRNKLGVLKRVLCVISAVLISSCGSTGGSSSSQTKDISAGLIAFYPFDGNAVDESGTGNNGTVNGAVLTNDRAGKANSAYLFNGLGDFIFAPVNINPLILPQMTMTAWVRADSANLPFMKVISHDDGGFDRTIGIDNRGGGAGWSAFTGTGEVLGFRQVIAGTWVFIASVYDQDAGTVKLFIDNFKLEESGTLGEGWSSIRIGSNPSFGEFFRGAVDEVRIYNRALSDAEIQTLFNL